MCVGMPNTALVEAIAPACLAACSSLCEPMDRLVGEYGKNPDKDALKPMICASASSFDCLFSHTDVCGVLREKAAAFGMELPADGEELRSECKKLGLPIDTYDGSNSSRHEDAPMCSESDRESLPSLVRGSSLHASGRCRDTHATLTSWRCMGLCSSGVRMGSMSGLARRQVLSLSLILFKRGRFSCRAYPARIGRLPLIGKSLLTAIEEGGQW